MTDPFVQHTREGSPALLCRRQEGAGVLEYNGVERGGRNTREPATPRRETAEW